jgi:hypothetical protein
MVEQGRTISFQLSTGGVDKLSNVSETEVGHFVQTLNPAPYVPFYAQPKVALYSLSFANTFTNIDSIFKNQTLDYWWYNLASGAWVNVPVTIPAGNYNRTDIEIAIATQLKTNPALWTHLDAAAKDVEVLPTGGAALVKCAGVADAGVADQWFPAADNPPLTFLELQSLVATTPVKIDVDKRYIKPVTIRHNPQTNRIELILLGNAEIREGSTLATVTLGLDASQMASATDHWTQVKGKSTGTEVKMPDGSLSMVNGAHGDATKQKAAEIDNVRQLGVHLPSLIASSYDRNGEEKGAQVASVPIRAAPGDSEAWEVSSPLWMPCPVAGSYIENIEWFITNERGQKVDCQGGHIEATVVLMWGNPTGKDAPPSSLAARTDITRVVQPWARMR